MDSQSINPSFAASSSLIFGLISSEVDSDPKKVWEECEDEHKTGQKYWRHRVTGEFKFENPLSSAAPSLPTSPISTERKKKFTARISRAPSSSTAEEVAATPRPTSWRVKSVKSMLKSKKLTSSWAELRPFCEHLKNVREPKIAEFFHSSRLQQIECEINSLSQDELEVAAILMLERQAPEQSLSTTPGLATLVGFVSSARLTFKPNPYHDFRHAVDGMQFMFHLFSRPDVEEQLLGEDVVKFLLLVVCLTQDAAHDGQTNAAHREANSTLVVDFGVDSPLEKMHFSHCDRLLKESKLLDAVKVDDTEKFMNKCRALILATDMEKHGRFVTQFMDKPTASSIFFLLMKLCDVSNVAREFDQAKAWAKRLEAELKLNGSFVGNNSESLSSSVMEFSDMFVLPLADSLGRLGMDHSGADIRSRVEANVTRWARESDAEGFSGPSLAPLPPLSCLDDSAWELYFTMDPKVNSELVLVVVGVVVALGVLALGVLGVLARGDVAFSKSFAGSSLRQLENILGFQFPAASDLENGLPTSKLHSRSLLASMSADSVACVVCFNHLDYISLGQCEHRCVCATCAFRLRQLHHDERCAVCKAHLTQLFIIHPGEKRKFAQLGAKDGLKSAKDGKTDIVLTLPHCLAFKQRIDSLREMRCCEEVFSSRAAFEHHLVASHSQKLCGLCVENRGLFFQEHARMSSAQLARHTREEHPSCKFCRGRAFYNADSLYKHLGEKHEQCHVCAKLNNASSIEYFRDFSKLQEHFKIKHFVCTHEACRRAHLVNVYGSEVELRHHEVVAHQASRGMPLALEFKQRDSRVMVEYPEEVRREPSPLIASDFPPLLSQPRAALVPPSAGVVFQQKQETSSGAAFQPKGLKLQDFPPLQRRSSKSSSRSTPDWRPSYIPAPQRPPQASDFPSLRVGEKAEEQPAIVSGKHDADFPSLPNPRTSNGRLSRNEVREMAFGAKATTARSVDVPPSGTVVVGKKRQEEETVPPKKKKGGGKKNAPKAVDLAFTFGQ